MVWNSLLQCYIYRIDLESEGTVSMFFKDGNCCDMSGAIKLAKKILPTVRLINTYAIDIVGVKYCIKNGKWKAI